MSKKRVHEIAKELKAHGIELDNKEVVSELVSLGYDVKSHSSSLEDDQAVAAVQKIVDKRKPKAAPPPVAAKGFVVRRKAASGADGAEVTATQGAPLAVETSSRVALTPEPTLRIAPPPEPEPLTPHEVEAEPLPVAPEMPLEVASPVEVAVPAVSAPAPAVSVAVPAAKPSAPRSGVGGPASAEPLAARGPGPRPSAPRPAAVAPRASAPRPAPVAPPQIDPRTLRPTATQAVVISRPTIPVRRVTPANTGRQIPMAPGRKAIGEVREFKVVPDHLGRGRELVDVSKKKGEGARKRENEKETFSQQDLKELVFGRTSIPIRGKKRKPTKKGQKTQITEMAEEKKVIKLEEGITVSELSQRMGVKTAEIIKKLMAGGTMATANQMLDVDTAGVISSDFGWRVEKVGFEVEDHLPEVADSPEDSRSRPPVVTVMGHVDHGKTSLLDSIRSANVAAGEAGGITQHIGAYSVTTSKGDITFLDTPGHEAFTSMRARGAKATDIVVLVVAADDGVMPQTKEAVNHARAAEVPIVVAINKMDVAGANPDRVKKDLADLNLIPEDWGGDTIMVPVSAKTKAGVDLLLENLALQAEVLELAANPNRPATGTIIEAKLEKGRGAVATVLVQEGTLRQGDPIVSGVHSGRVRTMTNDRGELVKELSPGYCAEVIGLAGVPVAGDSLNVVEDERAAKEIAEHRLMKERKAELGKTSKDSLESLLSRMKAGDSKDLKVVVKADVQGSLEAVAAAIEKLSTPKVKVTIVHRGVGAMTESDVMLAAASKGIVVGFNVRAESGAEETAKKEEVALHSYSIIYELLDGMRQAMEGMLEPIRTEKRLGRAEVRNLFNVPKLGTIAGAAVIDGAIKRTAMVRLLRDNKMIYTGRLASLKRFKEDVREVEKGFECGIGVENYQDIKPGDIIEAFEIEETRPSLA